jgi:hypothetical protein
MQFHIGQIITYLEMANGIQEISKKFENGVKKY